MKTAVVVLGILGSVSGFLALAPFFLGSAVLVGMGAKIAPEDIVANTFMGLLATILGLIGTIAVKSFNIVAAFLMISAAVLGFFSVPFFYIFPSILFFVGGILSFAAEDKN